MSGRGGGGGRGRGRGGRGQSPAGRGTQAGRGGGPGRGGNAAYNAPPSTQPPRPDPVVSQPSETQAPRPEPVVSLQREMERKLTLEASSSSAAPAPPPQEVTAMVMNPAPPASSKAVRFPARPGFGRMGNRIVIKANHFLVAVADRDLNHYDVSVGSYYVNFFLSFIG